MASLHTRPSPFERVIQALIFTLLIQAIVFIEKAILIQIGNLGTIAPWNEHAGLICSTVTAVLIGVIFSYFANYDKFHKIARDLGITRETSYPHEWFGAFLVPYHTSIFLLWWCNEVERIQPEEEEKDGTRN